MFATLYAEALPSGSFYDSNLPREPSDSTDRAKLERALAKAIGQQAPKPFQEWDVTSRRTASLRLVPSMVVVEDFRLSGRGATFYLVCRFLATEDHRLIWVGYWQTARLHFPPPHSQENPPQLTVSAVGPSLNLWRYNRSPLFHLFPRFNETPPGMGILYVPNDTYAALVRFADADRGDPAAASSRWLRMLYLSATTLTTLGFGDITPVTTTARTSVTAEALLGVVLIGLFLNALALRARARRYVPPRDGT